jgi:predicted dehydrogenase
MADAVTYQFEYDQRIRCAFIGAGGHSYRNVYPAFQYAPVDLVAVCDIREGRAATYARMFGAAHHYTDHRVMLEREEPEAVFIITSYDPDTGRVQATDLAIDCMRAGAHVWMEKPAAASVAEVRALQEASLETERVVLVGLKKIFTPAIQKVEQLLASEEFGPVSSIYVRYPQALPPPDHRHYMSLPSHPQERFAMPAEKAKQGDSTAPSEMDQLSIGTGMLNFLDHIYHPAAILTHLLGPVERFYYEWEPVTGSSVASLRFPSGAIGTLHLAAGIAGSSPLERLEVIGRDANIVVDNGVRITYYRPGADRGPYGRDASYLVHDAVAPLSWEPEFSLGTLSNKNLFYLGYVPEILHFCTSVQSGMPPQKGTLENALAIMQLYEAYQRVPAGTAVTLPLDEHVKERPQANAQQLSVAG